MTGNLDDFDAPPGIEAQPQQRRGKMMGNLAETWRTNPLFKLVVLMVAVGAIVAAVLGVFSGPAENTEASRVRAAPQITEAPGGAAPPAFQEAVREASRQRAESALQQGGSALPTPLGAGLNLSDLERNALGQNNDPLAEFRAESLQREQTPNQAPAQTQAPVLDPNIVEAMQQQMQSLLQGWAPATAQVVTVQQQTFPAPIQETVAGGGIAGLQPVAAGPRLLIPAGTVLYAQLLTEANSDVPGPILAQVLAGPFNGGKAIGAFEVTREYLVLRFTNVNYKGIDYPIDVLALNPNTTLGGLATEVDNRYFTRVVLPAAASFVEGFGRALSENVDTTTITNGTVVQTRARQGIKEGLYAGAEQTANTVGGFFREEAAATRPLVRVAQGTAMGLFFTQSVYDPTTTSGGLLQAPPAAAGFAPGPTNSGGVLQNASGAAGVATGVSANPPVFSPAANARP